MSYTIIKKYKSLQIIRFDTPIMGGNYCVKCTKEKKAKNGLTLDAAIEVFNKCIH